MELSKAVLVSGFNEWMRRYIENPEEFNREFESVQKFVKESKRGKTPSYGDNCAAFLLQVIKELKSNTRRGSKKVLRAR